MEIQNAKQQQLTFEKGITNVPSDAICSDNALAECIGLTYQDGEHRVIQNPRRVIEQLDGTLLFVHKTAGQQRYIYRKKNTGATPNTYSIKWRTLEDATEHTVVDNYSTVADIEVTAIGKTLILSLSEQIKYFLWKADIGEYSDLGVIPAPVIDFSIDELEGNMPGFNYKDVCFRELASYLDYADGRYTIDQGHQEDYNNVVIGLYSKCKKHLAEHTLFDRPFMVRFAVELYDGSYTLVSDPICMFPAVTKNCRGWFDDNFHIVYVFVSGYELSFSARFDYSEWEDIVKNVVLFVSDQVEILNTTGDQFPKYGWVEEEGVWQPQVYHDAIMSPVYNRRAELHHNRTYMLRQFDRGSTDIYLSDWGMFPIKEREPKEILRDLERVSVFYKLCEIGTISTAEWKNVKDYVPEHTLENITTQEQLPDDYYSRAPLSAERIMTYNNRLLLSNVKRGFYEGFGSFLPYDGSRSYTYVLCVYINTPWGVRIVRKEVTTTEKMGVYFFYPDPRAFKVEIYVRDQYTPILTALYKTLTLKEHPFLNGAYFFDSLPDGTEDEPSQLVPGQDMSPAAITTPEKLSNQIWTSEVNNPFVFRPEGNITIGNGNIIGISTLTDALSQGQFGQFPLIIFTDEGIWAASTGQTGLFTAVHPMSREVCNNVSSITQTDGAVFFTSEKGLMVVAGKQVKCVSEQMSGKEDSFVSELYDDTDLGSFAEFLKQCFIAYDYRDSLLWIFNRGSMYCYVYAIKSGTFSKQAIEVMNAVNNYPDYLLQDAWNGILSLTGRVNINAEHTTYTASFLTRPMKLENGLALKSIMQVIHIKDIQGSMTLRIFASNNLSHWVELNSLSGMPWKYYRFLYDFSDLKATDRFAGSVLVTQERRINRLR